MTIAKAQFADILRTINRSTFVGITSLTKVKTKVGDPVTWKLSRASLCVGSYQNAVRNRQRAEGNEPTFVAKSRPWGKLVIWLS